MSYLISKNGKPTYEGCRGFYELCIEAGQDRRSVSRALRSMGLTTTQVWAVINKDPNWF